MRIGKVMIDTDNMTTDELTLIINELRLIRHRKDQAVRLADRMNELITEAQEDGFRFIDKDCGYVREINDFTVFDERM